MEPMNLVIGASREYAIFTSVMLTSLFKNNPEEKFNIFFYYDEPMDDIFKDLSSMVEKAGSTFIPMYVDEGRKNDLTISNLSWWHSSIWYRYYFVEDLYGKYDRALIIGTDTIIQKELRPFYDTDLEDKSMMAVVDMGAIYGTANIDECKKHNCNPKDYVNTDVLLVDIKRAHGLISVDRMVKQYIGNQLWALDQDLLNFFYHDQIMVNRDTGYNFMPAVAFDTRSGISEESYKKQLEDATVIHYALIKPWKEPNAKCAHRIWFEYAQNTYNYSELLIKILELTALNLQQSAKQMRKMELLFWIQDLLWDACDNGVVLEKMRDQNIESIAIYGYGKLGKHLLKYCNDNGINVPYIVDSMKSGTIDEIPVIKADRIAEQKKVDAIVVTPIQDFEMIKAKIENVGQYRVISLEELVWK